MDNLTLFMTPGIFRAMNKVSIPLTDKKDRRSGNYLMTGIYLSKTPNFFTVQLIIILVGLFEYKTLLFHPKKL